MTNQRSGGRRRRRVFFLPTPRDGLIVETIATHRRLSCQQIRRLFFRRRAGGLASVQAVNKRLRKLVSAGYLECAVLDGGHGSGPRAYGLGPRAASMSRTTFLPRRDVTRPAWHDLEVAEFRVALQEALESQEGEFVEWLGEPLLRSIISRHQWPVPDALVHWRLGDSEGSFLLEWDRGTESLPVLTRKVVRYGDYMRARGYREVLPGIDLKPRLAVVFGSAERAERLIGWLLDREAQRLPCTLLVGVRDSVSAAPLEQCWWRSDDQAIGGLTT